MTILIRQRESRLMNLTLTMRKQMSIQIREQRERKDQRVS